MIIRESYQDVENYLRSPDLVEKIIDRFGDKFYNKAGYNEVTDFIQDEIEEMFSSSVRVEKTIICKVVNDNIDIIDTVHPVINYNGNYYDYTAQRYNNSFDNLLSTANIPITQSIIHSDNQINSNLSTVKGYVILGY